MITKCSTCRFIMTNNLGNSKEFRCKQHNIVSIYEDYPLLSYEMVSIPNECGYYKTKQYQKADNVTGKHKIQILNSTYNDQYTEMSKL